METSLLHSKPSRTGISGSYSFWNAADEFRNVTPEFSNIGSTTYAAITAVLGVLGRPLRSSS